jgi:hypothetical protein
MRVKPVVLAFGIVGGLLLAVFGFTQVFAQEGENSQGQGITVSPLVFELSANPGDQLRNSIQVTNTTATPLNLTVDARNFVALGEEGQPGLTEEETTFSLAKWVTAEPAEFTIDAKATQTINFAINTPVNAEPGGHFGSIVVHTKPGGGEGQVAIAQEVAPLVLLKVAGDIKEGAEISSFKANPNFSEKGPVNFELRIKNTGNVHFKPLSSVVITNMFGQEVGKAQFDPRNVLPDSTRKFETSWKPDFLFGRYTATATIVYGSENQVIQTTTTFWGFPTTLALMIGIPLILLGVLIFLGRKRLGRSFKVLFGKEQVAETKKKVKAEEAEDTEETVEDEQPEQKKAPAKPENRIPKKRKPTTRRKI